MTARTAAFALLLAACGGPVEETLVDELRILALVPDLPEVAPGESTAVTPYTVDPTGEGYDLLVWTCTALGPPGTPCAESQGPTSAFAQVIRAGDSTRPSVAPAAGLAEAVAATGGVWSSLRALACLPGTCEIMDQVGDAGEAPPAEAVGRRLADFDTLLREEPIVGVAASRRTWRVSDLPLESRNANPVVLNPPGEFSAEVAGSVTVELEVDDDDPDLFAYGYATAGGFGAAEVAVLDGAVTLEWFAPESEIESPVALFVVVQDLGGGSTVWKGTVTLGQDPP